MFLLCVPNQVKNELPSTFKAYRHQQHRWSCGPANLFRKMAMEIVRCKVKAIVFIFILGMRMMVKHQCHSDNSCPVNAESLSVEEVLSDIQFLLRPEDSSTYGHVHLLLRCPACNYCDSRSTSSDLGSCLHSFCDYSSECSWDAKVSISSFCLKNL